MRIGVNARFLIKDHLEGIGWYTYHILLNMVNNHPEHEYYFFFDRQADSSFLFSESVKPIVLYPQARHPILWCWWFEFSIPHAIKKYKIDLFFSPDGFASLSLSIPQYIVVHDLAYLHYPLHIPYFVRKYYQWYVPRQILKSKHVFAVSQATKMDIIRQFQIPENKINVAYNGVRSEFKPLSVDEINSVKEKYSRGKNYFLFVGAIHPRKNIANLIRAFNQFKKASISDFNLILVGRKAWQTEEIESVYHSSEYKENILFFPYLNSNELAKITAAAFYSIAPSLLEGFGVPVLEALYCDVPVMVSNRFSLPEVAGPGAIIFEPDDINDISHAMKQSVNDSTRNERIEAGRLHRIKFNWEQTSELIYKVFLSA